MIVRVDGSWMSLYEVPYFDDSEAMQNTENEQYINGPVPPITLFSSAIMQDAIRETECSYHCGACKMHWHMYTVPSSFLSLRNTAGTILPFSNTVWTEYTHACSTPTRSHWVKWSSLRWVEHHISWSMKPQHSWMLNHTFIAMFATYLLSSLAMLIHSKSASRLASLITTWVLQITLWAWNGRPS